MIKFRISVDRRRSARKPSALDMGRADFRLLRELVSRAPLDSAFECTPSVLVTF